MNCDSCPFRGRSRVLPEGDPETCKYVLVGEAPAYDEIKQGRPFVGKTGRGLMAFMARVGIEREECFITNALLCQMPRDKKGLSTAIQCCRDGLLHDLRRANPDAHIALMGKAARDAVFPGIKEGILSSRGWHKWEGRDVYVMTHPSYVVLYNPNNAPLLLRDLVRLKQGRQHLVKPFRVEPYYAPKGYYQLPLPFKDESSAFVVGSKEGLRHLLGALRDGSLEVGRYTSFDLETDQVDYQRDRVLCMSMSFRPGVSHIVPDSVLYEDGTTFVTTHWSKSQQETFLSDPRYLTGRYLRPDPEVAWLISQLFRLNTIWTGHNIKFDLRFLVGQLGVTQPEYIADTLLMHYTLDERGGASDEEGESSSGTHALKALGDDFLDAGNWEKGLYDYIPKKSGRYSRIPRDVLYRYNATDSDVTLRLAYLFEERLKREGLYERPYKYPIMAAVPMLLDAELRGINIDWEGMASIDEDLLKPEINRLRQVLRDISGHQGLNPLSSKRVIEIMYDEMNFPVIEVRTRAAGKRIHTRSTQKAVLDGWSKMWERGVLRVSDKAWEFAETLQQYRHLRKMQGSYVRKWYKYRGVDDRVHPSYRLEGTVTGRLSAKDPPVQTIPSKVTELYSTAVANCHIPQPGWKLLYADYSQAELMALACESGDEFMLRTFREGMDYHDEVAKAAYGLDFGRDDRQACKKLTFGWAYGGNVYEIAMDALQFEGPVAQRFAHEWDELFKTAVEWRRKQGEKMLEQGYVQSAAGRRRRYLYLTSDNVGKAKRVAINAPIQSIVSDLTLISAVKIWEHYRSDNEVHVILLIHDSLIVEVKEHRVPEVREVMHDIMVAVPREFYPQLDFKADVEVGEHLGELT